MALLILERVRAGWAKWIRTFFMIFSLEDRVVYRALPFCYVSKSGQHILKSWNLSLTFFHGIEIIKVFFNIMPFLYQCETAQ
jgi:hypothetical protein